MGKTLALFKFMETELVGKGKCAAYDLEIFGIAGI